MPNLCEFEHEVLASIAGRAPAIPWGAALGACLEFLLGNGLLTRTGGVYSVSAKGLAILDGESE